jgi:alkyl sulfatase BDS1-like metallo-beta-lactamase superfamily hydrolase
MPTPEECRAALEQLAARLDGDQRAAGFDRSVSAEITDVGLTFHGTLHDGVLGGITAEPAPRAQVRMVLTSEALLELADGRLTLATGWLSGRLKIHASLPDLLRLRTLL